MAGPAAPHLTRELIIEGIPRVQEGLNPRVIEQKLRGFLVVNAAGRRRPARGLDRCAVCRHAMRGARLAERWLVSYADFITLLFAFFATMYAISSVDSQKLATVAHALQVAFDDSPKGRSLASGQGLLPENGALIRRSARAVERRRAVERVARSWPTSSLAHRLELIVDRRGVTLSIPEAGTFAVGTTSCLKPRRHWSGRVAGALGRVCQLGARRRAYRRRADSQLRFALELGPLGRPGQPRGRISRSRAGLEPGAAVGDRARRVPSARPEYARPKIAPATGASTW